MATYKQAQLDESQRQVFLDAFLQENPNDNVGALTYNLHKKPGLDRVTELQFAGAVDAEEADALRKVAYESTQYAFLLITFDMIGKGEKHPIIVNPRSFELDEASFASNIADHEYIHTHDFRYGIPLPDGTVINHANTDQLQPVTLEAVLDTRALFYQLMKGREKGIQNSDAFMNAIHGFLKYYHILKGVEPANDFERDVIRTQIASYQGMLPEHLREK
jgi:hypothetical protein|tara:strand:+ start:1973 stop:2629 length:657 start_codon:yes stop_codon:yes gene_type:complete